MRFSRSILFLLLFSPVLSSQEKNNLPTSPLRGNGIMFAQNMGQVVDMEQNLRPDVLFKGNIDGADIYLRKTGISYVLNNIGAVTDLISKEAEDAWKSGKTSDPETHYLKLHRVDLDFENCNLNTQIITSQQVEGHKNFYYAHCPDGITNVNTYNEVIVKNIYKNIDVKYYGGKQQGLKYDIVVNPGADPNDIKIKYSGADGIEINNGKLKIHWAT